MGIIIKANATTKQKTPTQFPNAKPKKHQLNEKPTMRSQSRQASRPIRLFGVTGANPRAESFRIQKQVRLTRVKSHALRSNQDPTQSETRANSKGSTKDQPRESEASREQLIHTKV